MTTGSGNSGAQWVGPESPGHRPDASPGSGYGTPSSASYGQYGQGVAPPWGQPQYGGQRPKGPDAFRASGGLGLAVVVLSSLLAAVFLLSALLSSSADRRYEDAVAAGRSTDDVFTAFDVAGILTVPVMIAAWVVTCVWLSRARENALLINPGGQRRSAVWVWLGWLVPIVSLWF